VQGAGVAERVTFVGPTEDVPSHLLEADVLIVPAGEVTPLVLMEAMAHGTPVIAARMGSIPDVVGDAGMLVERDYAPAIADAVQALAAEPERALRLATAARTRVEELYDQARSHRRLEAEIARLIESRASGLRRRRGR